MVVRTDTGGGVKDFTAWNLGAQIYYGPFVLGGGYVDAGDFQVTVTGAHQAPTAAFTATASGLTASVDASASTARPGAAS